MPNSDRYPQYYSPDGGPWDDPCWNDDHEQELLERGYKSIPEWNSLGYVIKKGKKGIYLSCARKFVFYKSDIKENHRLAKYFHKKRDQPNLDRTKKNNITSKEHLILFLVRNNALYIKTKANIWKDAFILKNGRSTLFILFRKTGVDLKLYDGTLGKFEIEQNTFSFDSGKKLSLSYSNVSISIFYFIVQLVSVFNMGIDISSMLETSQKVISYENSYSPFSEIDF